MSEQNKDSIENFFRERAQNHNIEFNESDWMKLEKQLDQELPVGFSFLRFLKKFWVVPLLALLIPSIWFTLKIPGNGNNRISGENQLTVIEDKAQLTDSPENTVTDMYLHETGNYSEQHIQQEVVRTETDVSSINNNYAESNNKEDQNMTIVDFASGKSTQKSDKKTDVIGYAVLENGAESGITQLDLMLHFLYPLVPGHTINHPSIISIEGKESINEVSPKIEKRSGLYAGIGYSPDFSTVGIGNFVAPGSRWNFLLEYGFSNRFFINTGVVWVQNQYEAYGEDYHAPPRYWKKGIVAEEAYGECVMVDLPLNIRYNALMVGKSQFFVSAGASTYFLLKEDYYFHYEQEDPELPDHWGTDKMTVYPFGIVNLSLGYQLQFTPKSAIQVEPFIKIPTAGIGWGNVDLYTMGIYFMYKYKITRN